jgi:hypothetical protein
MLLAEPSIRWPKCVHLLGNECLDCLDFVFSHGIQFGHFHEPVTLNVLFAILGLHIAEFFQHLT